MKTLMLLALLALVGCSSPSNPGPTASSSAPAASGTAVAAAYTCSMHPEVVSDKPGKCPKCNMDLIPKK